MRDLVFGGQAAKKAVVEREFPPWRRQWIIGLRVLTYGVLAAMVLFQLAWTAYHLHMDWLTDLCVATDLVTAGCILTMLKPTWLRWRLGWLLLLVILLPAWTGACVALSDRWHQEFAPHYATLGLYPLELRDSGPQTILVLHPRCYPLFGSRRQHRVCQPVYTPSPEWLLEFLREEKVTLIVAELRAEALGHRRFLGFDECLDHHAELFRKVGRTPLYTVFEVLPSPARFDSTEGEKP